jgi:hypothetical protein
MATRRRSALDLRSSRYGETDVQVVRDGSDRTGAARVELAALVRAALECFLIQLSWPVSPEIGLSAKERVGSRFGRGRRQSDALPLPSVGLHYPFPSEQILGHRNVAISAYRPLMARISPSHCGRALSRETGGRDHLWVRRTLGRNQCTRTPVRVAILHKRRDRVEAVRIEVPSGGRLTGFMWNQESAPEMQTTSRAASS